MPENDLSPSDVFYLTKDDVLFLRALREERAHRRVNPYGRPYVPEQLLYSPEVYLAITPAGGIPALVIHPGTGSIIDITAGSAVCQVYRYQPWDTAFGPLPVNVTVWNLASTAVAGGIIVLVAADKNGNWYVVGNQTAGAGSGTSDGALGDAQFADGSGGFKNSQDIFSGVGNRSFSVFLSSSNIQTLRLKDPSVTAGGSAGWEMQFSEGRTNDTANIINSDIPLRITAHARINGVSDTLMAGMLTRYIGSGTDNVTDFVFHAEGNTTPYLVVSNRTSEGTSYTNSTDGDINLFHNLSPKVRLQSRGGVNSGGNTGTAPKFAMIGGCLYEHYADVGNTDTLEDNLYSDTIYANTLSSAGDKLRVEYGGIFVSSATATRRLRIYFCGTNLIFDSGNLTISANSNWTIYVTIIRVNSSTYRYMVSMEVENAALATYTSVGEVTPINLSVNQTLLITGQSSGTGAAANDIVAKLSTVYWYPASV